MASRETPACLARVAPVCLSLCGDAGANSGCLRLTDFILIKLKIFLIITKHSQKAMTSIFTKKSQTNTSPDFLSIKHSFKRMEERL